MSCTCNPKYFLCPAIRHNCTSCPLPLFFEFREQIHCSLNLQLERFYPHFMIWWRFKTFTEVSNHSSHLYPFWILDNIKWDRIVIEDPTNLSTNLFSLFFFVKLIHCCLTSSLFSAGVFSFEHHSSISMLNFLFFASRTETVSANRWRSECSPYPPSSLH